MDPYPYSSVATVLHQRYQSATKLLFGARLVGSGARCFSICIFDAFLWISPLYPAYQQHPNNLSNRNVPNAAASPETSSSTCHAPPPSPSHPHLLNHVLHVTSPHITLTLTAPISPHSPTSSPSIPPHNAHPLPQCRRHRARGSNRPETAPSALPNRLPVPTNSARMQHPRPSPSPSAQRGPPPPPPINRPCRRARSPPAKRRRTATPAYDSPSPSPQRFPSPEPQRPTAPTKWFRKPSVVWYRGHDLRVEDHPALLAAAQRGGPVVPLFVWDPCDGFGTDLGHVKQWWLKESLLCLQRDLHRLGVQLYTRTGPCTDELRSFLQDTGADAVFWNRCYEPKLLTRDEELRIELASEGLTAESFKAELLVEPWELTNTNVSRCFETFHGYMRAWMTVPPPPQPLPCPSRLQAIKSDVKSTGIDALGLDVPFSVNELMSKLWTPGSAQAKVQLDKFLHEIFPAFGKGQCRRHLDGTSRLSPHIRFGELSPRRMYHSTRLRVSRWDQASMLATAPASTGLSPVRTIGGVAVDRGKKLTTARETPENGTAAKRKRGAQDIIMTSPSCKGDVGGGDREGLPKAEANERSPPYDTEQKRPVQRQKRPSASPRRSALPHISLSARAFLKNLCLRDFSYHVLFHNPEFDKKPLIPEFVSFPWAEDKDSFEKWRLGNTGYPIVDAAMRELRETGWIHNGMRFLLACFLTKYLLLPWSRGLKEFYGLLIDGDHSANALGWQWTAGSNTDAFPVSCLVSPFKVALRHDPTGSYVRRWLPELDKVPTKFIHQPWNAPSELLKSLGIELGTTYPNRVVLMSEARNRALDAMRVMKQIFSGSSVSRGLYQTNNKELIKEWPEEQSELSQVDEGPALTGHENLLASLWAVPLGDQSSTYPLTSTSGNDSVIAMDTASLAEGSLAVPMDDQHESIEHALITAHTQAPAEALSIAAEVVAAGDRALGEPTYAQDKNSETQAMIAGNPTANGLGVDHLDEPLKYAGADVNTFAEPEKMTVPPPSQLTDGTRGIPVSMRRVPRPRETIHPNALHSNESSLQASTGQTFSTGASHTPYSQQQIQPFQQLQQLQQLQLQRFPQLQQQRLQQQSRQQQHQQHHPQQRPRHQHQSPAQHLHHAHAQQQRHQAHVHPMMDGIYGPGSSNGALPGTSVAGVPMAGAPVMMGPATSAPEIGVNTMFSGAEPGNAMYAPQMGMGQFYGFPHVLPVLNAHALNGNERIDAAASTTGNAQKLAVQGMLPMTGYGIYGGSAFDPNILGNTFAPNGAPYGQIPTASQTQTQGGPQPQYGFPPHPMYFTPATSDIMPHMQGAAHMPHPSSRMQQAGMTTPTETRNVTAVAAAAAVDAGSREVADNVASELQARSASKPRSMSEGIHNAESPKPSRLARSRQSGDPMKSPDSSSAAGHSKAVQGRKNAKTGARSKPPARKRGSGSGGIGRHRGDGKGSSGPRGRSTEGKAPTAQRNGAGDGIQNQGTTLTARQEILASVLRKEDHEYHAFANHLATSYELTGNTDRHTSKDYIRLCNLKDDYHKQCKSDKDKLKIYRIKAFFSKILKLEVTGEWDRHNHGGVRGPYVYGIRLRKTADSSQGVAQN